MSPTPGRQHAQNVQYWQAFPIRTFADFLKAAKNEPGKLNLGGSGLNSATTPLMSG